jgi:GMP synthase-like glutamine amidotransferase
MKPLYIFRHVGCEGPGYLGTVLEQRGIPYQLVCVDHGDPVPAGLPDCAGLVFMGGPMSVNDDLPWIGQELSLIRAAQDNNVPVLGHCLGGQLISKALGGEITRNPVKEIGWLPVCKTPSAQADHWLEGLPDEMTLFHWHGETFSIPAGAERILESEHCANQAFVIGNTLALQCHIELTAPMVGEWADRYAHEISNPSGTVQSLFEMTADLDRRIREAQQVADTVYAHWLGTLAT